MWGPSPEVRRVHFPGGGPARLEESSSSAVFILYPKINVLVSFLRTTVNAQSVIGTV